MLRQGIPHKVVQERLGHARVGTTPDIYSHVSPRMQKEAALRFQEAMAEARAPVKAMKPVLPDQSEEVQAS